MRVINTLYILSHGYLLEGYLPVRIAFPSLASMLLEQIDILDKILVSSFADSLSSVECQLIKTCLTGNSSTFSVGVTNLLIFSIGLVQGIYQPNQFCIRK